MQNMTDEVDDLEDLMPSDPHESLLYCARNGDLAKVKELLEAKKQNKIVLDVSCKGKAKSNLGWTPLHLATYFGQLDVADTLLEYGADPNVINDAGDTPLHKAAFIGHEELVISLLRYGADVNVMNGEGKVPKDMSKTQDIHRLLLAAEHNAQRERELKLLTATREGNIDVINELLRSSQPPNINCVDAQGNSCLHCVAYRGHTQAAVILLQNGIDSTIRNINGQLAIDLAKDGQMRQVLSVRPLRQIQRTATRFEGQLLKRSRFLGWKTVWAVLQRGVLSYYGSRADANSASSNNRREWKYLDNARVVSGPTDNSLLVLHFSDGTSHKLRVPNNATPSSLVVRQEWITAFKEHIAYSAYYLWGCAEGNTPTAEEADNEDDEVEDDGRPLGSMQDALTAAANHLALLESQLGECGALVSALERSIHMGTTLHQSTYMRFQHAASTSQRLLSTLRHCAAIIRQADETRGAKLKAEKERCRVLEEALAVLAAEHHELEQSFVEQLSEHQGSMKKKRHSRFFDNSEEEFYDAFNPESDSDTIVSGGGNALSSLEATPHVSRDNSPTLREDNVASPSSGKFPDRISPAYSPGLDENLHSSLSHLSPASSCSTIMTCGGNVYRTARNDIEPFMLHRSRTSLPVPMFSRNDFSLWSVLKNCIGKELSKITMPVVFNEPLSFLQRMIEYMEYAKLLRIASEQEDPIMRMQYVAAFAVSALASNRERLGKPFNPLLGETYELQRAEFRALAEQVSHHPPVSAFHADSPHFIFHGSVYPKLRFWGKSVEIQPKGQVTVELPRWGEAYTWSSVNCCVHNIIVGRLWMEQYGNMEVVCHTRGGHQGLRAQLVFKPAGWASKDLHRVEGFVVDKNKKKLKFLYGKWTEFIKCCDVTDYDDWCKDQKRSGLGEEAAGSSGSGADGKESPAHTPRRVLAKLNSLKVGAFKSVSISETDDPPIPEPSDGDIPKSDSAYSLDIPNSVTLWEAAPRPENTSEYYQFTAFAMSLNEMEPSHGSEGSKLCPTDSRLRPDIRCLERGDVDGAAREKNRLEEKQRAARKLAKKTNQPGAPRWFSQGTNPYTKQDDWLYNGGYWDRNYEHLANVDIF